MLPVEFQKIFPGQEMAEMETKITFGRIALLRRGKTVVSGKFKQSRKAAGKKSFKNRIFTFRNTAYRFRERNAYAGATGRYKEAVHVNMKMPGG